MSSKMAAMDGDSIRVTRTVAVPQTEIEFRFSRSSGPGGQHAQKSETRVEALFDVEASTALSETQKRRVVARAGPVLRAVAQDERSQTRNRELATERVIEQLRDALRVRRRRIATRPTAAPRGPPGGDGGAADGGWVWASPRGQASPQRRQAAAAAAGRITRRAGSRSR